jgi:essential nuclear protein 1
VYLICFTFFIDQIAEKINEKRTEIETQFSDAGGSFQSKEIDPKVVEMYQGVGQILAKYRSGKVPKAFKVVAQFR